MSAENTSRLGRGGRTLLVGGTTLLLGGGVAAAILLAVVGTPVMSSTSAGTTPSLPVMSNSGYLFPEAAEPPSSGTVLIACLGVAGGVAGLGLFGAAAGLVIHARG